MKLNAKQLAVQYAEAEDRIMTSPRPDPRDEALLQLRDACSYYERIISWDISCPSCAQTLDSCLRWERRADEAEAALVVAQAARLRKGDAFGGAGEPPAEGG